jgi:hypothetical protein
VASTDLTTSSPKGDREAFARGDFLNTSYPGSAQPLRLLDVVLFFCRGAGPLFLARTLWIDLRTKTGRIGGWWLIFVGIAYIGAGIFASDPTSIVESRLHGLFGIIVIFRSRSFSRY